MELLAIVVITTSLLIWWFFEKRLHDKRLASIKHRLHINGSRGKSSTTRLVGAVMRAGGFRTVTKTTGTNARFIFPDGTEEPIVRIGSANIKEQRWVVRKAANLKIDCLVTECMAIDPELQGVLQQQYIKGTVGILTNVRSDHFDVMGPTMCDAANAMSIVMPAGGICFTSDADNLFQLEENAKKLNCKLVFCNPESVTDEEMEGFSYIEHKENVCIALAIAEHFGIDRKKALAAQYATLPDPGALRIYSWEHEGQFLRFANAFAANDPESTTKVFNLLLERKMKGEKVIVVANSRADRIHRASQLGELMAHLNADAYALVGAYLNVIVDSMRLHGDFDSSRIGFFPEGEPVKIFDFVKSLPGERKMLVGIGNIGGPGHEIVGFFSGGKYVGKKD